MIIGQRFTNRRGETRVVMGMDSDGTVWWKVPDVDGWRWRWSTPEEWDEWVG